MRAANESYALKMNIIVILLGNDIKPDVPAKREVSDVHVKLSLWPLTVTAGGGGDALYPHYDFCNSFLDFDGSNLVWR